MDYKNKYLKYKNKYLHLKYFIGGKKISKNNTWKRNFNKLNKKSFILFFNIDSLTNKNTDLNENYDYNQGQNLDKKHSDSKSLQDINNIIQQYNTGIKSNDYDKKIRYIINESFIFNNLALFKYKLGKCKKYKYNKGNIVPWIELNNFDFSTVEKKSTNSRYKNGFLIRLNKLQKTIKKNKLNITNTHLIKTFNYNNFHTLLVELINNINTIPNTTYTNKVIQITNEYNTISTHSVILNGIENTNENTNENVDVNKIQYPIDSKISPITNWIQINNVKYSNKKHIFSFNIKAIDIRLVEESGGSTEYNNYN
jgi:hypothetical protein